MGRIYRYSAKQIIILLKENTAFRRVIIARKYTKSLRIIGHGLTEYNDLG